MSNPDEPSEFSAVPPSVPLPGVTLGGVIDGKYRVERVVGRGGMGLVVAATHLQLGRTVAIKLIREEYVEDPLVVERLVREARAAASIQSEHVARVLDVGTLVNGAPFIVMEYLEGQDLDSLLQSDGPLQVSEAVDFILQACEAIGEAHFKHIVHRDLKPANLFVAQQPGGTRCVKVVDFGISKLLDLGAGESITDPSRLMGSLYHMAPEQISGDRVDARTDVWALGVLLFEMLTGRKPFRPGAWPAVCNQIVNESAPDLESLEEGVPAELRFAIRRCLRRAPAERYGNVAELAVEIMPFGSRRARHSLERIVRLATATGSLSAESLLPPPTPKPVERSASEHSQLPLSSDPPARPAAPSRWQQRQLWALGLLLGCGVVLVVGLRLSGSVHVRDGERAASQRVEPLAPSSDPALAPPQLDPPQSAAQREPAVPEPAVPELLTPRVAPVSDDPPRVASVSEDPPRVAPITDDPPAAPPSVAAAPSGAAALLVPRPPVRAVPPSVTAPGSSDPPSTESARPATPRERRGESTRAAAATRPDAGVRSGQGSAWDLQDVGYR